MPKIQGKVAYYVGRVVNALYKRDGDGEDDDDEGQGGEEEGEGEEVENKELRQSLLGVV